MYYLVYISQAAQVFTERDLIDLLLEARTHNAKAGITGMLVFVRDRFIQVLEGEQKAVEELYERIKKDNRHKKIQILLEGHLPSRLFGSWSMGFKSLGLPEFEQLSGYEEPEKFFRTTAVDDQSHPALVFLHLFFKRNYVDHPENAY